VVYGIYATPHTVNTPNGTEEIATQAAAAAVTPQAISTTSANALVDEDARGVWGLGFWGVWE